MLCVCVCRPTTGNNIFRNPKIIFWNEKTFSSSRFSSSSSSSTILCYFFPNVFFFMFVYFFFGYFGFYSISTHPLYTHTEREKKKLGHILYNIKKNHYSGTIHIYYIIVTIKNIHIMKNSD